MLEFDLGQARKLHPGGVPPHTGRIGGIVHAALLGLDVRHQFLEVPGRQIGVDQQDQALPTHLHQRLEVGERFVGNRVGLWSFGDDATLDQQQGVAVVRRLQQFGNSNRTGSAGLGLHDHRLACGLPEPLGHDAGQRIGRAACRTTHHNAHRLAGPLLRLGSGCGCTQHGGSGQGPQRAEHS